MTAFLNRGLLCLLLLVPAALAQDEPYLKVEIEGIESELLKNARAWLGPLPESPQARANYLARARSRMEQSLQALGYYRPEFRHKLKRNETPWVLTITVDPGEPVRLGAVEASIVGDAAEDEAFVALFADSGLVADDILDHGKYENFKRRVDSLALQRGYFDGQWRQSRVAVEPVAGVADVALHYDSGERYRFGDIDLAQDLLHEEVFQSLLEFEPGQPYDQAAVARTQAALQRTGYFSMVLLRPEPQRASEDRVPLAGEVYPAKRHSFDVGVGFSTDTEERVSLTWRTPRINRAGHSQETRLQASQINPSGRVTYSIPLSHPLKDVLQMRLRVEDNEYGDLSSNQKEAGIRRERQRNQWVYATSLRGLEESWRADELDNAQEYLLLGASMSNRRRQGSPVNPDRGFSQFYNAEAAHSSLGSDIDLLRLTANFAYITGFGERHRLVFRTELGAAFLPEDDREDLAPSLNFFAGGSQSLRGFGYQSIGNEITVPGEDGQPRRLVVGGDRLLLGSAEYQYRFRENWRGSVFLDAGDAFDEGEFENNYAAGVGVHYLTPVGAIRLELAYPFSEDDPTPRVHFGIGAEF